MKRFATLTIVILMLALSLTGCFQFKEDYSTHTVEEYGYSYEIKSLDYTLSDYLSRGDTIWYVFDDAEGKNTQVEMIVVMENSGKMYVAPTELTLGQLAKMEDKDIIAQVKADYQTYMNMQGHKNLVCENREYMVSVVRQALLEWVLHCYMNEAAVEEVLRNSYIAETLEESSPYLLAAAGERLQQMKEIIGLLKNEEAAWWLSEDLWNIAWEKDMPQILAQGGIVTPEADRELAVVTEAVWALAEDIYDDALAMYEENMVEVAPMEYALGLITDSTGNNTASEMIATKAVKDGEENYSCFCLEYSYPITTRDGITTNCTMEVYDAIYGGYVSDGMCFYTRVEKNAHFVLDRMGESKLPFDVEPEELFD